MVPLQVLCHCIQVFPLSLVFNILIFMFLGMGFFVFFFYLGFSSLLESFYDFWETQEIFSHHLFKYFFTPYSFSSCGTWMTQLLNISFFLSFCPTIPQGSVQTSQSIFSQLYGLNNSYWSIFKTTDSFLCHSFLVFSLSHKVLFCDYIFWFYNSHLLYYFCFVITDTFYFVLRVFTISCSKF